MQAHAVAHAERPRAEISTVPAIRLPSVCWAARPKITAVTAPPTASVSRLEPGDAEGDEDGERP